MPRISKNTEKAYRETVRLLNSLEDYEKRPPSSANAYHQERITELLRLLESPHTFAPVIHIAGTKGKSSTAYVTSLFLSVRNADHNHRPVGLFLSPFCHEETEQIRLNGEEIDRQTFCNTFKKVQSVFSKMKKGQPTKFECITAMAFLIFKEARTWVNVIEVGL